MCFAFVQGCREGGKISYCTLDPVMRERERMSTHMQRVGGSRSQGIILTLRQKQQKDSDKKDQFEAYKSLKAC